MNHSQAGLQVGEDFAFERRGWKVERVVWALMLLILVAAGAGAFGGGPLSWTSVHSQDGFVTLRYDRFVRFQSPAELRIELAGKRSLSRPVAIALSRRYLESAKVTEVLPPPATVETRGPIVTYLFSVRPSSEPVQVTFHLRIEHRGRLEGSLTAESQTLTFSQFAYP